MRKIDGWSQERRETPDEPRMHRCFAFLRMTAVVYASDEVVIANC